MFGNRGANNKINKVHKQALTIVYYDITKPRFWTYS